MSDQQRDVAQIELAARRLIPELGDRLARHGLGEIEVRSGDLRVRVTGGQPATPAMAVGGAAMRGTPSRAGIPRPDAGSQQVGPGVDGQPAERPTAVLSPAVGYFIFGDGLGPGLSVAEGAVLGFVDVLGVRHEVRAPYAGTVRKLVTETSEAVEYGQTLLELEAAGT